MSLKPPPRYANVPAHDLFDPHLPDPLFRTLAQLHGLAWQTKGERTPPATVLELAALRGLKERQMYNHLRELKARRRIRVENLGHGRIVIYPLRWEPGAALPTDERSSLTPADLAALADPSASPSTLRQAQDTATLRTGLRTGPEMGRQGDKGTRRGAEEQGSPSPILRAGPSTELRAGGGAAVTAKNCSGAAEECSDHVVVGISSSRGVDEGSFQQQQPDHDQGSALTPEEVVAVDFLRYLGAHEDDAWAMVGEARLSSDYQGQLVRWIAAWWHYIETAGAETIRWPLAYLRAKLRSGTRAPGYRYFDPVAKYEFIALREAALEEYPQPLPDVGEWWAMCKGREM